MKKKRATLLKEFKYLLILTALYLIFQEFFENLISNTVVKYIFHDFRQSFPKDIVFLSIILLIIVWSIKKIKADYIISNNFLIGLFVLGLFYLNYRIQETAWIYTSFEIIPKIKYLDILILISGISLIFFIKALLHNKKVDEQSELFEDNPIVKSDDDAYGYSGYASEIADKILNSHFKQSFSIGIFGSWGAGKTSFINLLDDYFREKDIIRIHFCPWDSSSTNYIVNDFFKNFQEELKPYSLGIAKKISLYFENLVETSENKSLKLLSRSLLFGDFSKDLKSQINDLIIQIDKKIIVYIDDLDRADPHEVYEVLRIIRNTANFSNVVFICAADRNYLMNSISKINETNKESYLEKFFQLEITLPYFEVSKINNILFKNLESKTNEKYHNDLKDLIFDSIHFKKLQLDIFFQSIRDITRFANSFILNFNLLQDEVNINDFFYLEILKLKFPTIYSLIYSRNDKFLDTENANQGKSSLILKIKTQTENNVPDTKKEIEVFLIKYGDDYSIKQKDISYIIQLLENLFPDSNYQFFDEESYFSISIPSNFYRYFSYRLLDGDLSEKEFKESRKMPLIDFTKKINEWVSNGLEWKLKHRFEQIHHFDDKEDFEKIIQGIIYLGSCKSNFDLFRNIGCDVNYIFNALNNQNNRQSDKYYEGNTQELKKFILNLFNSASSPYLFEAYLISELLSIPFFEENFPLEKKELKEILISYFKKYLSQQVRFEKTIWEFYTAFEYKEWEKSYGNQLEGHLVKIKEANTLLIDFIENKDLHGFIFEIIITTKYEKNLYSVSKDVTTFFGSFEEFGLFLSKQKDDSAYVNEFKDFYLKLQKNEFKLIPYDFKIIPDKLKETSSS